eukprot:6748039-Alexandrium_andersonii.AAC.1
MCIRDRSVAVRPGLFLAAGHVQNEPDGRNYHRGTPRSGEPRFETPPRGACADFAEQPLAAAGGTQVRAGPLIHGVVASRV